MEIAKLHKPCEEHQIGIEKLHNCTNHVKRIVMEIAQMHKPCETNCHCTNAQTM
jgi:hypothetical protein